MFFFVFIGLSTPLIYSLGLFAAGTVVWFAVVFYSERRKMRIIEARGVYKPKMSKLFGVLLILAILAITILFLLVIGLVIFAFVELQPYLLIISFFAPLTAAIYFVPAVYGWLWQRRNKRTLYLAGTVLYPYPYINIAQGKETIY